MFASDGGERKRHPDLAEHCLRGLSYIYARHEDAARVADMEDLLETVQSQRRRLAGQRVPDAGLAALLPRRPWTQAEMKAQLTAALRTVSTVAPSDGATAAPPGGATVAPPNGPTAAPSGQQNGPQGDSTGV